MDLDTLSDLTLPGADGADHRLGDYWAERPVALVFLRHFGWLHCRHHAAQLRGIYEEIRALGAGVVAIGTGNARYARAFVEEEQIPFPVLVDDDGEAAHAASVKRGSAFQVLGPATYGGSIRAWRAGHNIHKPGKRTFQLGATFIVGPGNVVTYEHLDSNTTDHAPLDEVLGALRWAAR